MGKFNRELAKETELQTMNFDDPTDSQGVEIKSPGKMHWVRARGETYEDILKVWTTKLFDPDGDEVEYMVQTTDPDLRLRIFEKCDDNQNYKALVPCVNWFGTEFLWVPTVKGRGSKIGAQSSEKAIKIAQETWCKIKWRNNSVGWCVSKHPGSEKEPQWSTMTDDQIIDRIFENKIIDSLDHEALIRNNN
tara:strand:+ start:139 stop:711 length:573 start_codon:yes stop_codon:yes gene_type:complete